MQKKAIGFVVLIVGLTTPLLTAPTLRSAGAEQEEAKQVEPSKAEWELLFPEGEGKSYVLALCQQCHTLKRVALKRSDAPGWRATLGVMIAGGANLSEDDVAILAPYLAENFGPNQPPLNLPLDLNQASLEQLSVFPQLTKDEAAKILEARKKKSLRDISDLKQVLSDEKITKIKPFVVVH